MNTHPAADLFPLMTDAELDALAGDIKEKGLIDPIVQLDGAVLDGRNRLRACEIAGVSPMFREWAGEGGSPIAYVASENVQRRHLTISQRAAIGAELIPMLREETRQRQAVSGPGSYGAKPLTPDLEEVVPMTREATAIAGGIMGVSKSSVAQARRVQVHDPGLFEAIKAGEVSATAAERKLVDPTFVPPQAQANHSVAKKKPTLHKYKRVLNQVTEIRGDWSENTLKRVGPAEARRLAARTAAVIEFLGEIEEALRARDHKIILTRNAHSNQGR